MRQSTIVLLAAFAALAADARAVTIDWVPVGNPGNAADPATGSIYGAVPYAYQIDKYDVTNSQYVEFLNAKDPGGGNTLGLYNSNMSDAFGGISFNSGAAIGSKYSVISGNGNHPVSSTTWNDAIRFANWLDNGQGNGDTETGAYTVTGGIITRNPGAHVVLPSENEWYKAAYYNPNPNTNSYFQYPTSSDTTPTASGPTALPNHANYAPGGPGSLTDVGAYSGTTSPYGAFDMGGNIEQWNEALVLGTFRGLRGGSFFLSSVALQSSFRDSGFPTDQSDGIGFRVASVVPEPGTLSLAALGFIALAAWSRRRHSPIRAIVAWRIG